MTNQRPLNWLKNPRVQPGSSIDSLQRVIHPGIGREVRKLHRAILGGRMSPLKSLGNLSALLGLGNIWIKDESQRLTLNSFKVLGGSYAIYSLLKEKLGIEDQEEFFAALLDPATATRLRKITFAAATDGNHGRGVAWAAAKLGCPSVIYVHEGTSPARIQAIESYGAKVSIIEGTYDDAVRRINADAKKNGWQVIEDTAWEGYEDIPIRVMQGYTTMFVEIQEQLSGQGFIKPTHIFVQAGVGSLAASTIGYYRMLFGTEAPLTAVVEPETAACIFESARIGDGRPHSFPGNLKTIMAGLSCGDPNPIAWDILRDCAEYFITCPDYVAAKGMRVYATPLKGDPFVLSGESGAITLGTLMFIMQNPEYAPLKEEMGLGLDSQVLLLNTEGNTDPSHFRQVVWEGSDPVPPDYRVV
ncbi:MAG: diaminopropionate ammonia-lyase [Candidatus Erginobacter occultus]|nr:diaminopropionate ammonia-lyase [Candidatus Erginobacter occultus]